MRRVPARLDRTRSPPCRTPLGPAQLDDRSASLCARVPLDAVAPAPVVVAAVRHAARKPDRPVVGSLGADQVERPVRLQPPRSLSGSSAMAWSTIQSWVA